MTELIYYDVEIHQRHGTGVVKGTLRSAVLSICLV
jgi:hypothetical protein